MQNNLITFRQREKGFTLIELSIVLLIVAILILPLLQMYQNYLIQQKMDVTKTNIQTSSSAMGIYSPIRLPCPSDRALPLGAADYGKEKCDLTTIPACNAGLNQGICKTVGSRDAGGATENSDPDGIINANGNDSVVIGGVPFKKENGDKINGISAFNTVDGWNRKLTYAVSAKLMATNKTDGKLDFKYGVIGAVDEFGNPTAGVAANIANGGTGGDAQYVIVSHGQDGAGAFDLNGVMAAPCPTAPSVERENCNNDFTFVQGIGSYEGAAATYLDDVSYFYTETSGDLWFILSDAASKPSPHINNLNTKNVGIKTTNPQYKLDVNGAINTSTARTDRICDYTGTKCMEISSYSNLMCPAGNVAVGFKNGNFMCSKVSYAPLGVAVDCHAAPLSNVYWVRGLTTKGCVICSNGTTEIIKPDGCMDY